VISNTINRSVSDADIPNGRIAAVFQGELAVESRPWVVAAALEGGVPGAVPGGRRLDARTTRASMAAVQEE